MEFEWDPEKAALNEEKHGVTFGEASTVFGDPFSLSVPDPLHSDDEQRMVIMGLSGAARLIVAVYVAAQTRHSRVPVSLS